MTKGGQVGYGLSLMGGSLPSSSPIEEGFEGRVRLRWAKGARTLWLGAFWGPRLWLGLLFFCAMLVFGVHQLDERGQITAFYALKMGAQPEAHMPWEYAARMRPWLQPAVYYVLLWPLHAIIGFDFLVFERLSYLVQPVLAFFVVPGFVRLLTEDNGAPASDSLARWGLRYLACLWFVPGMLVRHASEAWCALFFAGSLYAWWRVEKSAGRDSRSAFLSGLLAGLGFWSRFHLGLFVAGFWLCRLACLVRQGPRREWKPHLLNLANFALAIVLVSGVCVALDTWGYGRFTFSPWAYFEQNVLLSRAASFGVRPWHHYLVQGMALSLNPLIWVWLILAVIATRKDPFCLAISVGTFCFLVPHFLMGHKEPRFLFPLLPALAVLLMRLFSRPLRFSLPFKNMGLWPGYLKALAAVHAASFVGYCLFGLVSDRGRVERALWALPPGQTVITATSMYALFGYSFEERARRGRSGWFPADATPLRENLHTIDGVKLRHAFLFAKPPQVEMIVAPAGKIPDLCGEFPEAVALLTSKQVGEDARPNLRLMELDDVAPISEFPPAWLRSKAGWYRRMWRFKLTRCAELLRSSARLPAERGAG